MELTLFKLKSKFEATVDEEIDVSFFIDMLNSNINRYITQYAIPKFLRLDYINKDTVNDDINLYVLKGSAGCWLNIILNFCLSDFYSRDQEEDQNLVQLYELKAENTISNYINSSTKDGYASNINVAVDLEDVYSILPDEVLATDDIGDYLWA